MCRRDIFIQNALHLLTAGRNIFMMGFGKDIDMYKKVYYFGYIFTADKGSGKNMSN